MIVPAIVYKDEIENQFKRIQYTDKYLWYTGSIDNYNIEVETTENRFAYAIVHNDHVIGYISFRVDWYCSMAYNFGLVRFADPQDKAATAVMTSAIMQIIKMILGFNLHRIDFRCISGNPAQRNYDGIIDIIEKTQDYWVNKLIFTDNIKDYKGRYHSTICYELLSQKCVENVVRPDTTPSCNSCLHNGEWSSIGSCIKCRGFDGYERRN